MTRLMSSRKFEVIEFTLFCNSIDLFLVSIFLLTIESIKPFAIKPCLAA